MSNCLFILFKMFFIHCYEMPDAGGIQKWTVYALKHETIQRKPDRGWIASIMTEKNELKLNTLYQKKVIKMKLRIKLIIHTNIIHKLFIKYLWISIGHNEIEKTPFFC